MHIIRLRRPWTKTTVDSAGVEHCDAKANVPDLDTGIVVEQMTYCRSFNRPTGLSDQTKLFLAVSDWQGRLQTVLINQNPIDLDSGTSPLRVDITSQLAQSNKLEIQITKTGDSSPLLRGEVQIEIEDNMDG